jgi:hypothetical protein
MAFSDYYRHMLTYLTYFSPEIHIRSASLSVQESHNSRWVPGYAGILFRQLENGTKSSWENWREMGNHPFLNGKETHLKPAHTHHQRYFGRFFMLTSHENQCGMDWSQDGAIQKVKEDPPLWLTPFSEGLHKWSLHGTFEHRTHQPDIWLPPGNQRWEWRISLCMEVLMKTNIYK